MTSPQGTVTIAPVVVDVTIRVPVEAAFRAFTADFARWWPMSHHIGADDPETVVIEPWVGGRWFERAPDGTECPWGEVLAWDPPHRVELAWNLDGTWTYQPGRENASRVDVRFSAVGPGLTRVVLEHRGFEAHGPGGGPGQRAAVAADGGGWPLLLQLYAAHAREADPEGAAG